MNFKACLTLLSFGISLAAASAANTPKLLPFQGYLTDPSGKSVADGTKLIQFRLYDAPVSGQAVWSGELHRTTVNAGLVNVLLGSRTPLEGVDFDRTLYIEITVDANADDAITSADPPLLPRQALLPVVFAKESADSRLLGGYDWSDVFDEGATNPARAKLSGSRIVNQSITTSQLASNSVTTSQLALGAVKGDAIARGAVGSQQITNGAVGALQIADGAVTLPKLATRLILTNSAGLGDIAFSQSSRQQNYDSISATSETAVTNLAVALVTTGRPVLVFLSSVEPVPPVSDANSGISHIQIDYNSEYNASLTLNIYRSTITSTALISRNQLGWGVGAPGFARPFLSRSHRLAFNLLILRQQNEQLFHNYKWHLDAYPDLERSTRRVGAMRLKVNSIPPTFTGL